MLKLTAIKYSYFELMDLSLNTDLKTALRPNHRILLTNDQEVKEVSELLKDQDIPFVLKGRKEIWIEKLNAV